MAARAQTEDEGPSVTVVAAYLGIALLAAGLLFFLGLPWRALLGMNGRDPFGQRTMLAGLGVLTVWAWQWLELTGASLEPGLVVLVLLTAPAAAWTVWRRRPRPLDALAGAGRAVVPIAASLPVFAVYLRDGLHGSRPQAVSISNNDLPLYALQAQHLLAHGFRHAGAVPGYDMGSTARNDVFGAFDLIGATSYLTHLSIPLITSPLLLLAMSLTVGSLARLVRAAVGLALPVALAVGLVACSTSLYLYSIGQGFFAQLFGTALFGSLVAVAVEQRGLRRPGLTEVGEVSLLLAGLLGMYPHMAFVGLPILLAIVGLAALLSSGPVVRDVLASLTLLLAGFAVLLVVDGTRVVEGARRTFAVGSSTGGYGLARARVGQIVGWEMFPGSRALPTDLRRGVLSAHLGSTRGAIAVMLLLLLVGVLVRLVLVHVPDRLRHQVAWSAAAIAAPLASYYVFYAWYGVGYLEWKWLVFYQPLAQASLLALMAVAVVEAVPRVPPFLRGGLQLLPLAVMAAGALSVPAHLHQAKAAAALHAADDPRLRSAPGVNIEALTRWRLWDAMWAGVQLKGKQLVFTTHTYFPTQPPVAAYPTLRLLPDGSYEVLAPLAP